MTPSGWSSVAIGELAATERNSFVIGPFGSDLVVGDYTREGVPVVFVRDVKANALRWKSNVFVAPEKAEQLKAHSAVPGDVVITKMGLPAGVAAVYPATLPEGIVTADIIRLRLNGRLAEPRYISEALNAPAACEQVAKITGGQTRPKLTLRDYKQIQILLPPLGEQRKIAAILSSVDEAIEASQAVIDQLQVVKKAMMAELLTRGLPGRHMRFKMTEIGEIPEEWEVVTLGAVGQWLSGGTPSKQDSALWVGSVPWVSPKDMKRPRIDDAIDHVSEVALQRGTQLAPVGSVLMVVRGMILAHTFPVAVTTGPVAFNQDIKALVPTPAFESEFVLGWLQHRGDDILALTDVSNHGTKRLPSERLSATAVPKPSMSEQQNIVAVLRAADVRAEAEVAWRDQLRIVKSALMSVLLTGEVRVKPDEEAS